MSDVCPRCNEPEPHDNEDIFWCKCDQPKQILSNIDEIIAEAFDRGMTYKEFIEWNWDKKRIDKY